jgi:hypothetical protein
LEAFSLPQILPNIMLLYYGIQTLLFVCDTSINKSYQVSHYIMSSNQNIVHLTPKNILELRKWFLRKDNPLLEGAAQEEENAEVHSLGSDKIMKRVGSK